MKKLIFILSLLIVANISFGQGKIIGDGSLHETGNYPIVNNSSMKGGLHQFQTIVQRNALLPAYRDTNMVAYVADSLKFYVLTGGIDNSNWQAFASGGSCDSCIVKVSVTSDSLYLAFIRQNGDTATKVDFYGSGGSGGSITPDTTFYKSPIYQDGDTTKLRIGTNLSIGEDGALNATGGTGGITQSQLDDSIASAKSYSWNLTGNSNTTSTNFIGTIANQPLVFKVNNLQSGYISNIFNGNTSFGRNSLPPTSGTSNQAFGSGTLQSNTTGYNNNAIGYSALLNNTTGYNNTASGWSAMGWNTNGIGNTAMGWGAMNQAGSTPHNGGAYNTALGYSALSDNWDNKYNIGLGSLAGSGSTSSNTLYISDSTYHMKYKLDSVAGVAPSVIGKDENGFWHTYANSSSGGVTAGQLTDSLNTVTWERTLQNQGSTPFTTDNTVDFANKNFIGTNLGAYVFSGLQGVLGFGDSSNYGNLSLGNASAYFNFGNDDIYQILDFNGESNAAVLYSDSLTFRNSIKVHPNYIEFTNNHGVIDSQVVIKANVDSSNANPNNIAWFDSDNILHRGAITSPTITSGSSAPSSTPAKVGDIYIDTTAKKLYFAGGTSSSSDWIIAN